MFTAEHPSSGTIHPRPEGRVAGRNAMSRTHAKLAISAALIGLLPAAAAAADPTFFSTGAPDGLMATATRPDSPGKFEIESADDVILGKKTSVTDATFIGLMPAGVSVSSVVVEFYRVFPNDSNVGRTNGAPDFSTPNVPTRVNSPSDVAFDERDASSGLSFSTTLLEPSASRLTHILRRRDSFGIRLARSSRGPGRWRARGAAFRRKPLSLAKTCSIGLRSGEYLGRNRR